MRESPRLHSREASPTPSDSRGPQVYISRPHNIVNVVVGTIFLWIGWFGFNGGSALGANIRAISACVSTFLAASAGGVTWSFLEYLLLWLKDYGRDDKDMTREGKFSVLGFCNGVIAGLVAITPAAGYVSAHLSA